MGWPEASILLREQGPLRYGDLVHMGLYSREFAEACKAGIFRRLAYGLYCDPKKEYSAEIIARKRFRRGILCLQSALHFHGLAPRPDRVWVAIIGNSYAPKVGPAKIQIVRLSAPCWHAGAAGYEREGTTVYVHGPAKAIIDCLKFRRRIGINVGLDALKAGLDAGLVTTDELTKFAAICRVRGVLAHYLDAGSAQR